MSSDKLRQNKVTQTGSMPRVDLEPILRREAPPPSLPELHNDENSATTGEMPVVIDTDTEDKVRDDDTPTGK